MSLDFSLVADTDIVVRGTGIFARRDGQTFELSVEEARELYPHAEINEIKKVSRYFWEGNITHNLCCMAKYVGLYKELWDPSAVGITKAQDLLLPLAAGLSKLLSDREGCEKFNPANGWGSYDVFLEFVQELLAACAKHPHAKIEACP